MTIVELYVQTGHAMQMHTKMTAVDPTYPLLPIASFLSAAMLFLVLLTGFIHRNLNLGVGFLCFWLLLGALANGTNFIIWSDNVEIKLYVYCDIGVWPFSSVYASY